MRTSGLIASTALATVVVALCTSAQAQWYDRHDHPYSYQPNHYHDSVGHMVDAYGHHVDAYGRRTGSLGLYDSHSVGYGTSPYLTNYGIGYGTSYGGTSYGGTSYGGNFGSAYVASYPPSNAVPVASSRPPNFGLPIKIVAPSTLTAPINYTLDGYRYVIRAGESQSFVNDRRWVVQFDRGGELGLATYELKPGIYEFGSHTNGWDLYYDDAAKPAAPGTQPLPTPPAPAPRKLLTP